MGSVFEYLRRYLDVIFSQVESYMRVPSSDADKSQNAKDSQDFICGNLPTSKSLNMKVRQLLQDLFVQRPESIAFLLTLGLPFCKHFMSMPLSRKAAIVHPYRHGFHLPRVYLARGIALENFQDTFEEYSPQDHMVRPSLQSLCPSYGFCNWLASQNNESTLLNCYKA